MKKICTMADSPASGASTSTAMNRSATLSTTGRSFTTGGGGGGGDAKTLASFVISKPPPATGNDAKSSTASKRNRLTKAGSKKVTLQTSTTLRYDESFMRYVNGFDSYFKASELRNQSSGSKEEAAAAAAAAKCGKSDELSRSRLRYATEVSTSAEATSSGSLSDARSFSLDSPRSQKKRSLPRVSVVYDTAPHIDLLDSPKSFSETASSYYATPDQDRSFITTPSDNHSFFATASEQSSYLTAAELESWDESHTFVQDARQFSSQETLYNDDDYDIFKDDDDDDDDDDEEEEEEEDEMRDRVADLAGPSTSANVTVAFSRLNLRCSADEVGAASASTSYKFEKCSQEAKVRRSNFVRSTCIDLEEEDDEEDEKKDGEALMGNSTPVSPVVVDEDEGRRATSSSSDSRMERSST